MGASIPSMQEGVTTSSGVIVDNTAWETGGGIVAYTDRMLIENCLIANNEGGGITTYNDNTVVDHCTVTGNGGFGFFIWCLDDADMYVSNTVASGNGSRSQNPADRQSRVPS